MPTETRSLHRKLAEVMAEAERIPKNGTYTGQGGFKYVLVGDAANAIRKALAERKVSMLPSAVEVVGESEHGTKSGGTMTTITIRTTWTLVDGESGEEATIQSLGTGADTGDKYSPKAQTNAMKYALLMGFLLSTGDDPEQSDTSDRRTRVVPESAATRVLTAPTVVAEPRTTDRDPGGITGTAEIGTAKDSDFQLRRRPTAGRWASAWCPTRAASRSSRSTPSRRRWQRPLARRSASASRCGAASRTRSSRRRVPSALSATRC